MLIILCAALGLAAWAGPAAGQAGWSSRDGRGGPKGRTEASERLDLLRMWRLIDKLEVREDQAADLFPMWSRHRRERRELQAERARLAEGLAQALDEASSSESQLLEWMGRLAAVGTRRAEAEAAFSRDLGKVLDVRQRAHLLLFQDQFRGEISEMVRGLRGMPSPGTRPRGGKG